LPQTCSRGPPCASPRPTAIGASFGVLKPRTPVQGFVLLPGEPRTAQAGRIPYGSSRGGPRKAHATATGPGSQSVPCDVNCLLLVHCAHCPLPAAHCLLHGHCGAAWVQRSDAGTTYSVSNIATPFRASCLIEPGPPPPPLGGGATLL
jgi:hypothetical protein